MTVRTPHRVRRHDSGPFAGRLEHFFPEANASGHYVLADPSIGREMHHVEHSIRLNNITEAVRLVVEKGYSIRMRGNLTGQWNLIRRDEIRDLPDA